MILGILNLATDSFSDGGEIKSPQTAMTRIIELLEEGADFVDIGAESSRPGATALTPPQEWSILEPVLALLKEHPSLISNMSVDSYHDETALKCYAKGIRFFNNIKGLYQDETLRKIADSHYVCMHMHENPSTMQDYPLESTSIIQDLFQYFNESRSKLDQCGLKRERVYFDPGIGFGKTDAANFRILASVQEFTKSDFPMCLGLSRKSFIGRVCGIAEPKERDSVSKALECLVFSSGARIIRTHDVKNLKTAMYGMVEHV
jgi:dihydropteroate synthase